MTPLAAPGLSRLLLVDVQERLAPHVHDAKHIVSQCINLLGAARVLQVPVVVSEHYPQGLGHTVPALREQIAMQEVYAKDYFSCFGESALRQALTGDERSVLVIAGMEAHVCVVQTALEGVAAGLDVRVVADAVGSRRMQDRDIALTRMQHAGVTLVSREMLLFEWCRRGASEQFRTLHRQFLRSSPADSAET